MENATTPAPENDADRSLLKDIDAVVQDTLSYAMSRLSLAAVEAKTAIISVALILALALFSAVLLCSLWGLACFAVSQWMISSGLTSVLEAMLAVLLANTVALALTALGISKLARSLSFEHTLNEIPAPSEVPE